MDIDSIETTTDLRLIENKIEKLSKSITANFHDFWTQKIGKTSKIELIFEPKNHGPGEKAGNPYLAFWVKDREGKLYPKQRSKGVQWFSSFYLQLKASSKASTKTGSVLLIDEPGGSLHARAQEDVLKVFEDIKDKIQVIYTTHSPYLIKLKNLYRLLAIQRANENDDKSETQILDIHKLGAASTDTLSPIYTLMGIDFSHQDVIRKNNNVLLEEISAYYYISAFWKLSGSLKNEVSFLAATGVKNIPKLANLFLGWGLDFIVVVDDDRAGRRVYNQLKQNFFVNDDASAAKKLLKIKDCKGIEDLFTQTDFKKHVLEDETLTYTNSNSEYMKKKQKAVTAIKFMLKVENSKIKIDVLEKQTKERIKRFVTSIESLLD